MSWIDALLGIIFIFSVLFGLWRGFFQELFHCILWFIAFWLGSLFLVRMMATNESAFTILMGLIAILVVSIVVIIVLGVIFSKIIPSLPVAVLDHFLGAVMGVVQGVIICAFLVTIFQLTTLPQSIAWYNAQSIQYLAPVISAFQAIA